MSGSSRTRRGVHLPAAPRPAASSSRSGPGRAREEPCIGTSFDQSSQVVDQVEQRRLGPMHVVDSMTSERSLARQSPPGSVPDRPERLLDAGDASADSPMACADALGGSVAVGARRPRPRDDLPPRLGRRIAVRDGPPPPATISTTGQNVMPSPYGRHRPRSACARSRGRVQRTPRPAVTCRRPPHPGSSRADGVRSGPRPLERLPQRRGARAPGRPAGASRRRGDGPPRPRSTASSR